MGRLGEAFILVVYLLRSCQVSHSVGLTIDNQLVIVANDCYTRVAIGSKLRDNDIFSNVAVSGISECEDECSRKRSSCTAFAFGIGIKGNGTCALSTKMPKAEELQPHADYDVYVRSQRTPHCESDRIYKMGGGIGQERRNETRPAVRFGGGLFGPTMPSILSPPRTMGNVGTPSTTNGPSYRENLPSFDDERRISDILNNRNPMPPASNPFGTNNAKVDSYNNVDLSIYTNHHQPSFGQRIYLNPHNGRSNLGVSFFRNPLADVNHLNFVSDLDRDRHTYKALTVHNGPFEVFSRPIFVHDGTLKDKSPTDFGFWRNHHDTAGYRNPFADRANRYQEQGNRNNAYNGLRINTKSKQNEIITDSFDIGKVSRPSTGGSYNFEVDQTRTSNGGFKDTPEIWTPALSNAFRGFGTRLVEKSKPCYRRLLSGKKSLELHIRRAIECEKIEDCHRACDYEKLFTCEGFNYRRVGHGVRGMCEMTSTPYSRMDVHRDFVSDSQCDYYERDPNCLPSTLGTRTSWWNQQSRPGQSYGPSYPFNGRPDTRPYIPNRQSPNEVPRPLDYDRRPTSEISRPLDFARRPLEQDRRPVIYRNPHRELYGNSFDQKGYLGGQGSSWSGYPAARPEEDRFSYGGRFPSRRPIEDDYYNRNLAWGTYPRYPDKRIDQGSAQDIGTNEIGSYWPDHRKDPGRDWGSYGAVYGGSYGYNTNYIGKFDIPKYHPKPQFKSTRPYENDHFYGEFYNYGGAFGYGDSYIPASQDMIYGETGRTDACSVRAGAGFKLSRGVVRRTYLTPDLDQCESLCVNEKSDACMSFSYRYNVALTDPTDNCLISDVSYKDLNFYTDLEPDRDYDIYAMITSSKSCGTKGEPNQHPPDECFWRVRSGFGMPTDVVRKSMIVDNLGGCQIECTMAQDFMCRSFAFKYGLEQGQQDGPNNCYLSDWPSQDINPANMPDMDGAELYERGSFGRGCEPYAVPFFNMGRTDGKEPTQREEVCYSGYSRPCKLTPYAVLLATYVSSEQDCRQKCSRMRKTDSVPCMSYSYRITIHGMDENCLLSDVPIRDLRLGLDYVYDDDHVLYAWKDLDPHCIVAGYPVDNDDHVFSAQRPTRPLLPGPSRPPDYGSVADYPGVRPGDIYPDPRPFFTISKPIGHYHGVRPFDPDKPDPVTGPYRPGGLGPFYPGEYSTFQYYTVNGYPCKRGTRCERNVIAGFWACETEDGGFGSWDYCCEPNHQCGFSQGYNYPWCYVGSSENQWRPCNENYYPYLPSPRPIRPSVIGNGGHDDRPILQVPGHYGRHWPITYLHKEPPPNCTDSLASADNSENRHSNEMTPRTIAKSNSTVTSTNGTIARTRRRRLRSRMTIIRPPDDHSMISRKIGARNTTENGRNRERIGKIERVSKPARTVPSATVAATAATNASARADDAGGAARAANVTGGRFKRPRDANDIIRLPLIAPNNPLLARV